MLSTHAQPNQRLLPTQPRYARPGGRAAWRWADLERPRQAAMIMTRRNELAHYCASVAWVVPQEARRVYQEAMSYCSQKRHGLSESVVDDLETCNVASDMQVAAAWLSKRIDMADELVFVVFGEADVCGVAPFFLVREWSNMFTPSRDDVVVLPRSYAWVLFYCHEDVWEFGRVRRGGRTTG